MVTCVTELTGVVVTGKVTKVVPAGTVTVGGTVAMDGLLLVSPTTVPPTGAAAFRVIVPVEGEPPVTLVGFTETEETAGEMTISVVACVPLKLAVMLTGVGEATGNVVTWNVAVVAPADTVTLIGTVAAAVLLLVRVTTAPPEGAAAFSAKVPVEDVPPVTVSGLTETEETAGGLTVSVVLCMPL